MKIQVTLFGQMITFAIFVWFSMRFVWPKLLAVMDLRAKRIADGLAAAEKGLQTMQEAELFTKQMQQQAKTQMDELIAKARLHADRILEDAVNQARSMQDQIIAAANEQAQKDLMHIKKQLQNEIANLVILGAEKIIQRSINSQDHQQIIRELENQLHETS